MLFGCYLTVVLAEFPTDSCWVEEQACLVEGDNLLASIPSVPDVTACRQLCQDTDGCELLSHFGAESFPFREHCLLFSSCGSLHACQNCTTEDRYCYSTCGANVTGVISGGGRARGAV